MRALFPTWKILAQCFFIIIIIFYFSTKESASELQRPVNHCLRAARISFSLFNHFVASCFLSNLTMFDEVYFLLIPFKCFSLVLVPKATLLSSPGLSVLYVYVFLVPSGYSFFSPFSLLVCGSELFHPDHSLFFLFKVERHFMRNTWAYIT